MDGPTAFIMMPFKPEFDDVFDIVKQAVATVDAGLTAVRTDEIRSAGFITDDMIGQIQGATLCIADLTESNPNVLWEVGFATALKKPTVAICQEGHAIPFDVKDVRKLGYSRTSLSRSLRQPLTEAVKATLERYSARSARLAPAKSFVQSKTIAITGSMDAPPVRVRRRLEHVLAPYLGRGSNWLVGSSGIVDEVTVEYLLDAGEQPVSVVGYSEYDISGPLLQLIESRTDLRFLDAAQEQLPSIVDAPSSRDVLFMARSDLMIILWNGSSVGTRKLIDWVEAQGKDHLVGFTSKVMSI